MVRAPDGVLVVLDDNQRVAIPRELGERVEEDRIVPRMQADGGLVEDVTDTLQIRAQLRGKPDALRLTAGQSRSGAIELQIGQADALEELQARAQLVQQVACDFLFTGLELQFVEELRGTTDRLGGQRRDRAIAEADIERDGTQPLTVAGAASLRIVLVPLVPPDLLACLLLVETGHLDASAVAAVTPAMLGVEREQARIELGEAPAARGAGALGREYGYGIGLGSEHVHEALAEIQRASERGVECRVGLRADIDLRYG